MVYPYFRFFLMEEINKAIFKRLIDFDGNTLLRFSG